MKTVEQKAKRYDEAIDRAKKELDACGSQDCDAARQIFRLFPELKESEDEKIRKAILGLVMQSSEILGNQNQSNMITWLEKQCKKSVWTDNDRIMAFTLLRDVTQMTHLSNEGKNERLEWLNTLEDRFKK